MLLSPTFFLVTNFLILLDLTLPVTLLSERTNQMCFIDFIHTGIVIYNYELIYLYILINYNNKF